MTLILLLSMLSQVITDTRTESAPLVSARIDIEGHGYNGTDKTGPVIRFAHGVTDGIILGAGDPFRATGSRIERLRIVRLGTGGTAIKIVALSAAERPGEIVIRDVLCCGMSDLQGGNPDNWETALLIDGGPLTEAGKAGIRRIRIDHFRAASCVGDAIIFRNVTHLCGTDIQGDRGTSGRVPTLIIEDSRHVNLSAMNWFGELHIRGRCEVVNIEGFCQTVYVSADARKVNIRGIVDKLVSYGGREPLVVKDVRSFLR